MFIGVKLLSALLLPPGIIIAVLFMIALYMFLKKDRLKYIRYAVLSAAVCLYLLSIPLVSNILMQPLEDKYTPKLTGADAVVVLGGGAVVRSDALNSAGMLGAYSANRLLTALQIASREGIPVVITGGAPLPNSGNEAQISRNILLNLNLDDGRIIVEDKARNTHENAANVMQLCKEQQWRKIYIVTSAFHMPRSMAEFNAAKGTVDVVLQPYPCDYQTGRSYKINLFSFVPQQQALSDSSLALHEYLGLAALSLKI